MTTTITGSVKFHEKWWNFRQKVNTYLQTAYRLWFCSLEHHWRNDDLHCDSSARYKTADLLTYLLTYLLCSSCVCWFTDSCAAWYQLCIAAADIEYVVNSVLYIPVYSSSLWTKNLWPTCVLLRQTVSLELTSRRRTVVGHVIIIIIIIIINFIRSSQTQLDD